MAHGTELTGAGAPAQFIYVWPSRKLIARSWSWPASWHEAFQDAASRIGLAVALHALGNSRLTRGVVAMQLSTGFVRFRVERRGASVRVTVVAFAAPDAGRPSLPDDAPQPDAADGLILGLHGCDRGYYLVVFHGHMPPIPAENGLAIASVPPAANRRRGRGTRLIVASQGRFHGIGYGQGPDLPFIDCTAIDRRR
jgi:hypothetical protein